MIRRNVAGQVIYFPQLTTTDGTAITSSATLTVAKDGVEAASAGTLAHSDNGVWKYTPTQSETDAAIVGLVLTATSAVPVVLNLVTTAANTAAVALGANTTTPPTATENADAVFSSSESGPSTGGQWGNDTMGRRLLRSTNTNSSVQVASNHVAASVHSMQDDSISATAVSADAVTKIVTGVWSALTSGFGVAGSAGEVVKALASMLEFVGGLWRWKASSLAEAPTGGGGGDATEAKQDQIISLIQGSEVLTVATPNVRGNLVLTQGDTYDGVTGGNAKATWTVSTDYTDGWSVVLTIRDKDDVIVYTNSGTVVNATTITVAIVTPTVSPFDGCPGVWQGKYDVQLSKSTSKKTIAIGTVYINEDQTRS